MKTKPLVARLGLKRMLERLSRAVSGCQEKDCLSSFWPGLEMSDFDLNKSQYQKFLALNQAEFLAKS